MSMSEALQLLRTAQTCGASMLFSSKTMASVPELCSGKATPHHAPQHPDQAAMQPALVCSERAVFTH